MGVESDATLQRSSQATGTEKEGDMHLAAILSDPNASSAASGADTTNPAALPCADDSGLGGFDVHWSKRMARRLTPHIRWLLALTVVLYAPILLLDPHHPLAIILCVLEGTTMLCWIAPVLLGMNRRVLQLLVRRPRVQYFLFAIVASEVLDFVLGLKIKEPWSVSFLKAACTVPCMCTCVRMHTRAGLRCF